MGPAAPVPALCPDAMRSVGMPSLHLGTRGRARSRPAQRQARVQAATDPVLKKPESPRKPMESEVPEEEGLPGPPSSDTTTTTDGTVTIQWQRSQAKALVRYFEDLKFERIAQQPFFGWTKENEILNGRWVMFGIAVGLITEYATGVDFVHQVGLLISYLGLADFQD